MQEEVTPSSNEMVEIHSRGLYEEILKIAIKAKLIRSYSLEINPMMNIKYKTMIKKVKLVTTQLSLDSKDHIKRLKKNLD